MLTAALVAFVLVVPASAQQEADTPAPALGPSDIVNAAPQEDWVVIEAEDLLVMTLAPDREGSPRKVVIQLMPAPFSQGWVENIRMLARAKWYDGISVNRVQDNYVVQWGDPNHDNPEAEGAAKPLPNGLNVMTEWQYSVLLASIMPHDAPDPVTMCPADQICGPTTENRKFALRTQMLNKAIGPDTYARGAQLRFGWPIAIARERMVAYPVHCYGMVGVGRSYSPDTGTGAELYTVIGHAPRHLDRNIALVGRIVGGIEHLSSLPRGLGALGFYTAEEADKRVPILSIRVASDLPKEERPQYEYLSTETETFARYAEARANRRDPFFIHPAGGADICNIPVPVRAFEYMDEAAE